MDNWLPLFLWGGAIVGALLLIARSQSRRYQSYLTKHTEETGKLVAAQEKMIEAGRLSREISERRNVLLKRIAVALEARAKS